MLYDRVQRTIADLGARPQAIDAEVHDRLMATVSHLPHVLANVLVSQAADALAEEAERLPEVGPSFRDATRVAGANPAIWGDIFTGNREAVADEIDAVAARLSEAAELLRCGDREAVAAWHAAAGERRRELLESELAAARCTSSGSGSRTGPGSSPRSRSRWDGPGVNIEDMALYPAADMRSGAISLLIAGDEQAERAGDLVRELGHDVTRVER